MIWIQKDGKQAPQEAVEVARKASAELQVPLGILLGTCECETNFRLGLQSEAGAVGPMQFLPRYEEDYHRYAGFAFSLESFEAIRGAAAVFRTYAAWGRERHGLKDEDAWRFAVSAHRYGQNSKTCLDFQNKRVTDVESHMRRNGIWYDQMGEEQEEAGLAGAAAAWTLSKIGCRYSQSERLKENCFDCSSLVARAYTAQGLIWGCKGASVPTSNQLVYDDQFRLIWPANYGDIGKAYGAEAELTLAQEPGDLQFLCTDMTTSRANRITHVTMVINDDSIVHARSKAYGVRLDDRDLYAGKVCALLRYDPKGPLRRGMQGRRVLQLQQNLRAKGADIEADGIFGEETEKAVMAYGKGEDSVEQARYVRVTGDSVHLRAGPGTAYPVIGTAKKDQLLELAQKEGWQMVLFNGVLVYVAARYLEEV